MIQVVNLCHILGMHPTGTDRVEGIIGGFHLVEASTERIKKTVDALAELNVHQVAAGHCTGFRAQVELFQSFKNNFQPLHKGLVLEV